MPQEVEPNYKKTSPNEYLLAANDLANKYEMTNLTVQKLAAWCYFESGDGIFNNNPGNVRGGDKFFYHPGAVDEYINGNHVVASDKKDPLRKFRAFDTLSDGIEAMLQWLVKNHTRALDVLRDDNKSALQFAQMLGKPDNRGMHYYTADPMVYARGVDARFRKITGIA